MVDVCSEPYFQTIRSLIVKEASESDVVQTIYEGEDGAWVETKVGED